MMSQSKDEVATSVMGGWEWTMLLALAVLWGGSFFFNAIAVRELPSFTLVWLRVAVAAATLLLVLRLLGHRMPTEGHIWAAFFGMGLLNNVVPFVLIVWGQHHIASGLASILNATTPLFTVLVAHLLTPDEKLTPLKASGVVVGFAGAVFMIGPDALGGLGTGVTAQLACLAGALTYAFAGIFGRRFKRMGVAPMATAAGQVCASTVLLLPLMLLVDRPWTLAMPHPATWVAVAGVGLLSTALAYVLYFRILAAAGATNLLLVTFLIPVSAILLGALVLDETLLPRHFGGMALIGVGLACIDGRLPRLLFGPRKPKIAPGFDPQI
jgi:drug/metabolite transporter (DMT)-like permease